MECGRHSRDPHILLVLGLHPSLGGLLYSSVCPLAPSHWLYHPKYDRRGQARTWLGPPGIGRTVLSGITPTGNPIVPQQGCPVSLLSRLWSPTKCSPDKYGQSTSASGAQDLETNSRACASETSAPLTLKVLLLKISGPHLGVPRTPAVPDTCKANAFSAVLPQTPYWLFGGGGIYCA